MTTKISQAPAAHNFVHDIRIESCSGTDNATFRCPACKGIHHLKINALHWYPVTHTAEVDFKNDDSGEVDWDSESEMSCAKCLYTAKVAQFECLS